MSNTEKLIAEIQRLKKELDGYSAKEVLDYIESYVILSSRALQVPNPREPSLLADIDDAAEEYGNKEYPDEPALEQWGTGDYEPPFDNEYPREIAKDAFKAGAEWQHSEDEKKHCFAKLLDIKQAYLKLKEVNPYIVKQPAVCFLRGAEWMAGQGWKEVSEADYPKPDKDKLYCVHTKQHYLLATVILHPNDDGLCQWRCTEFPHHRYDMCEGDSYLEIRKKQ